MQRQGQCKEPFLSVEKNKHMPKSPSHLDYSSASQQVFFNRICVAINFPLLKNVLCHASVKHNLKNGERIKSVKMEWKLAASETTTVDFLEVLAETMAGIKYKRATWFPWEQFICI